MQSIMLEVSPLVTTFLDVQAMQEVLEAEAKRRWHCARSRKLSAEEKALRDFIGKVAFQQLSPAEKTRMLACVEIPPEVK